jgi:hypothetical protein
MESKSGLHQPEVTLAGQYDSIRDIIFVNDDAGVDRSDRHHLGFMEKLDGRVQRIGLDKRHFPIGDKEMEFHAGNDAGCIAGVIKSEFYADAKICIRSSWGGGLEGVHEESPSPSGSRRAVGSNPLLVQYSGLSFHDASLPIVNQKLQKRYDNQSETDKYLECVRQCQISEEPFALLAAAITPALLLLARSRWLGLRPSVGLLVASPGLGVALAVCVAGTIYPQCCHTDSDAEDGIYFPAEPHQSATIFSSDIASASLRPNPGRSLRGA